MATKTELLTPPLDLEQILAPLSEQEFLDRYWTKSFLRIAGPAEKFSGLLPWARLSEILSYHQCPQENLQFFKDGQPVPIENLVQTSLRPRRLDAAAVTRALADGATLILCNLDDLEPNVRRLAAGLEASLHKRVWVNLYAGFAETPGFDLHWDDHDTIILQLSGRKLWQVYEPTREHPLRGDAEKAERPQAPPIWEGTLEPGDVLHVPRGWWHAARPVGEPCLHLTVGIWDSTGVDLFHWLAETLKSDAIARQTLPHLGGREQQSAYINELWEAFRQHWTKDVLDRFQAEVESKAPRRPEFRLPSGPVDGVTLRKDSRIRMASPFRLDLTAAAESGMISFQTFGGRTWQCPEVAVAALRALNDGQPHLVDDLCALASDGLGWVRIHSFLSALAVEGVVVKDEGNET